MEELAREEAIRRHRLMWNWIADETEKTGELVCKSDAFKHFGWATREASRSCWCCEWAHQNSDFDRVSPKAACHYCPLDWSNGKKKIFEADCCNIRTCDGHTGHGLFRQWVNMISYEKDPIEASRLARIIANLPEKKEVKEHD